MSWDHVVRWSSSAVFSRLTLLSVRFLVLHVVRWSSSAIFSRLTLLSVRFLFSGLVLACFSAALLAVLACLHAPFLCHAFALCGCPLQQLLSAVEFPPCSPSFCDLSLLWIVCLQFRVLITGLYAVGSASVMFVGVHLEGTNEAG